MLPFPHVWQNLDWSRPRSFKRRSILVSCAWEGCSFHNSHVGRGGGSFFFLILFPATLLLLPSVCVCLRWLCFVSAIQVSKNFNKTKMHVVHADSTALSPLYSTYPTLSYLLTYYSTPLWHSSSRPLNSDPSVALPLITLSMWTLQYVTWCHHSQRSWVRPKDLLILRRRKRPDKSGRLRHVFWKALRVLLIIVIYHLYEKRHSTTAVWSLVI